MRRLIIILGISFYNAFIELWTALQSIGMYFWWISNMCAIELEISDEEGNIIHHFPQLNHDGDDDDF